MSKVKIARFVHVMSGGTLGKGWKESLDKRDTIVIALLDAMKVEIKKMADLGVTDPAWQAQHDDVLRALQSPPGSTGKRLMEYLEGVATQANQVLQELQTRATQIASKVDERRQQIIDLNTKVKDLLEEINKKKLTPQIEQTNRQALSPIKDELELFAQMSRFQSEADLDANIKELAACEKDLKIIERSNETKLPLATSKKISKTYDDALANPDSDMGTLVAVMKGYAMDYLEKIEMRKVEHQTDFHGLSTEDLISIHTYTSVQGFYEKMNYLLLGIDKMGPEERGQYQKAIDLCKQALAKLPDYPAKAWPTYRNEDGGGYDWASQFVLGKTFKNKIFWSTGRGSGFDAKPVKGPRLVITIFGSKAGKDVARMADNQTEGGGEILIPPGTTFKVLELDRSDLDRSDVEIVDGKIKTATVNITVKEVE